MKDYDPDPYERPDHPYAPLHIVWRLVDAGVPRRVALTIRLEQLTPAISYYSARAAFLADAVRKASAL